MNQKPLAPNRSYLIKQTTQVTQARVREIRHRIDIHTLAHQPASELELNGIGVVSVEAQRPLFFDPYRTNRATGSFILIDPITNETLGAGMMLQPQTPLGSTDRVTAAEREAARGHAGLAICLPADSLLLAWAVERCLFDHGYAVHVIHQPGDLRQAVRTAVEAGLIAVVVPFEVGDSDTVRAAIAPSQLAEVEFAEAAHEIVSRLETSGRLGRSQGPLTGGAGI